MTADPLDGLRHDAQELIGRGIRRVHVFAWRDLDDPDAGGSEVHADECERRWAEAGLEVVHRTSTAVGRPEVAERHGYRVVRRGSRYTIFPRAIVSELTGRMGRSDALVEVMNGVPFFSPLWYRRPRILFLHHVHGPMWDQILPGPLASFGRTLEARIAPPIYRRGLTATPSEATREELLELGFHPDRVTAIPNGTDPVFSPGGEKTVHPSVVAVARLAPVKRFGLLIDAVATARSRVPGATLTIVGDGPERPELEAQVARLGAGEWVTFVGRVEHHELVDIYRRSWIVASASLAEGWGLSLTEAAGCGTPAVATDIRGHRSSVVDGETGLLAPPDGLGAAIARVLDDADLRQRLGAAAERRVRSMTWDATAAGVLAVLRQAADSSTRRR
ncbi:glycosyltransferase family 4 protein [Ilumatobacter nonamiensis]|uniref:glycosyltransferase family 4 protein n=1 Tax=Ilumatobacter nonamiensis TaxID=467093 RepID=UPI00034C5AC7|nr:glycosyltransferase family 4 protein [Ilumatobacter nonamiensis]